MRFIRRLRSLTAIAITTLALSGGGLAINAAPAAALAQCSLSYLYTHELLRERYWREAESYDAWAEVAASFGDLNEYLYLSERADYYWGLDAQELVLLERCEGYGY
jgi:hypothetical protein